MKVYIIEDIKLFAEIINDYKFNDEELKTVFFDLINGLGVDFLGYFNDNDIEFIRTENDFVNFVRKTLLYVI